MNKALNKEMMMTSDNLISFLQNAGANFPSLNKSALNQLDFEKECMFAKQQLMKNDYTLSIARSNQQSLKDAIENVGSIGISLNPAHSYAYLVPRKVNRVGAICLDISYRGLIKLATDTGVIAYMKAELIYSKDEFEYLGFHKEPIIKTNPFVDRGDLIGVYAMAKLSDGGFLVETMTIDQVNQIRDDSEAYKGAIKKGGYQFENCVWVKYYEEMVKKTVIKRAYKTLPASKGMEVLGSAIEVINQHEGIEFQESNAQLHYTKKQSSDYKALLDMQDMVAFICLKQSLGPEAQMQLFPLHQEPNIPKGGIGRYEKAFGESITQASSDRDNLKATIIGYCNMDDDTALIESIEEMNVYVVEWMQTALHGDELTSFQTALNKIQ